VRLAPLLQHTGRTRMRHRRHRHPHAARQPPQRAARHQQRLALHDEPDVKRERLTGRVRYHF